MTTQRAQQWSYSEVTESAERRIRSLVASEDGTDVRLKWAYGVYLGWDMLTSGYQKDGDADRLLALADRKPAPNV